MLAKKKVQVKELLFLVLSLFLMGMQDVDPASMKNQEAEQGLRYEPATGEHIQAPLLSRDVKTNASGLVNRVTVFQRFKNESNDWINANYLFPLPENAAVDHLTIYVGKRVIIGEIKKKEEAKKIYETAKNEGRKASLVDQVRNNMFTTQIANIAPNEIVTVEIEYQHKVAYKAGEFSLRFPMANRPRYAPKNHELTSTEKALYVQNLETDPVTLTEEENHQWSKKWKALFEGKESEDLAKRSFAMMKSDDDRDFLVNLHIVLNSPLGIESAYHHINFVKTNENQQVITLSDTVTKAVRDFVLSWKVDQTSLAESLLFIQPHSSAKDKTSYGLLTVMPPSAEFSETNRLNKEVIFVIDVSGSMSGTSMNQAKSALSAGLEQLQTNDTFATYSLAVNNRTKMMAHEFINQLEAGGGTNLSIALQA